MLPGAKGRLSPVRLLGQNPLDEARAESFVDDLYPNLQRTGGYRARSSQ